MWLKDFLPQDVPKSRIFFYGYDSVVEKSINNNSISGYSKQLLGATSFYLQCEMGRVAS